MFARRTDWNLQPNALSLAVERAKAQGREIIDLTASNPTDCGFDYESDRIRAAFSNSKALLYEPEPFGILSARKAVAQYYAAKNIEVSPERILLTTSTSEAYSYLFRLLCNPGDEVLAPRPSYPLFDLLADVQDVTLKPYNLFYDHGWHLDLHSVEQQITERTRAVMVVSPNNPTGSYLARREADALEELCASRNLAIIADEVFLDYPLESRSDETERDRHVSAGGSAEKLQSPVGTAQSWSTRNRALTLTLSGLSKVAALPQLKLAWCAANGPEPLLDQALKRLEIIADAYLSVNAPIQHALPELLSTAPAVQRQIRSRCLENLGELKRQIEVSRGCSLLRADAGWYAILRIPRAESDESFAVKLLEEEGVLVHPGHFYNFIQEGYVVVSLLLASQRFVKGVSRLIRIGDGLLG
ncbi:MAG: pyridoxal phosphate-dependent aminotransferase [Acidobacteriaceae bacterium]